MSNFQPGPAMEATVDLKGGLKVQFFRRDPSKFAVDIPKWLETLNIGCVENCTICEGPSGHIDLVVFYRPLENLQNEKVQATMLANDALGLVCDLAAIVKDLQVKLLPGKDTTRPPAAAVKCQEAGVGFE